MTTCTAYKRDGSPCQAHAIRGSDPPRCSAHGGRAVGAPTGNHNRQTHGAYSKQPPEPEPDAQPAELELERIAIDLQRRIDQLSAYIDDHLHHVDADTLQRLLALHGQLCSRLSRIARDLHVILPQGEDAVMAGINEALDRLSEEWGIDL